MVVILIGVVCLSIWLIRGCSSNRSSKRNFQTVEAEVRSHWQDWHADGVSSTKAIQAPILIVICELQGEAATGSIAKQNVGRIHYVTGWPRIGKFGWMSAGIGDRAFEHATARSPDDLRSLVMILEKVSPDNGGGILKYRIVDWPTKNVVEEATIKPLIERYDKHPGKLKPFWTDTSFAYGTRSVPDWDSCWKQLRASLARTPPKKMEKE